MGRAHRDFINAADIVPESVSSGPWAGAGKRILSRDDQSGAETALVLLPSGWSGDLRDLAGPLELMALTGPIRLGEHAVPKGGWARAPQASVLVSLSSDDATELLAMTDPTAAPEGELTIVDVEDTPWSPARRGGPDGITVKRLYDGSTVSFVAQQRAHYLTGPEFHECPEELYVLDGDVTGEHGTMTPGSYFWRPEYVTHGPYDSEQGLVCFVRGHGEIHANWIDRADATPDENRAYAATLHR